MVQFTGNPIADAIMHINEQDRKPIETDFKCVFCNEGFDKGHGVKIEDETFCTPCYKNYNHFDFYAEAGANNRQILEISKKAIDL